MGLTVRPHQDNAERRRAVYLLPVGRIARRKEVSLCAASQRVLVNVHAEVVTVERIAPRLAEVAHRNVQLARTGRGNRLWCIGQAGTSCF